MCSDHRLARDPVTLAADLRARPEAGSVASGSVRARRDPYTLWGLIPGDASPVRPRSMRASRCSCSAPTGSAATCSAASCYGARASLSIGLVGVTCSLLLGIVFGGISGYFGGRIDWVIQRVIEFIISLPTIPIWLALAAALPKNWSPLRHLLLHHAHHLADRLDRAGARGARPLPRAALGDLRHRRLARRLQPSAASSSATCCRR